MNLHINAVCAQSINKKLSYRRQTALQNALVLAKVECDWETIFCGHLQPLSHNRPAKLSNSVGKKHKIRAIMPFKVIQGHLGRYQSKARMLLPISD